jgi:rhodanese-related sulfurtransferase
MKENMFKKIFNMLLLLLTPGLAGASGGAETGTSFGPGQLKALIEGHNEPYILVDVRTPEEFAGGAIPSAINIPYDTITQNLPTGDKKALIVVYCRSGRRSGIAKESLTKLGYTNIIDFGGINRWTGELVTQK